MSSLICGALSDIHNEHKVAADAVDAAAMALKAGCDLNCGRTYDHLGEAMERGLIDEADIDRALANTLLTRFKLGMFDPPEKSHLPLSPKPLFPAKRTRGWHTKQQSNPLFSLRITIISCRSTQVRTG